MLLYTVPVLSVLLSMVFISLCLLGTITQVTNVVVLYRHICILYVIANNSVARSTESTEF